MISLGKYLSSISKLKSSFRTTVPLPIAKVLELKHKDKVCWETFVDKETGEKYATVRVT